MNARFQPHSHGAPRIRTASCRPGPAAVLILAAALALALNGTASRAADARSAPANVPREKTVAARKPAAPTQSNAANPAAIQTNHSETASAPPAIPQSVFLLSSPTQTLRDPFFPNSTRLSAAAASKGAAGKKDAPAAELVLKAIFGTPTRPFATINSTTLGVGEEQPVLTSAGRVPVRCLAINLADQSVLIEVGGSRRELRFATPK